MSLLVSLHKDVKRILEDAILYAVCRELEGINGLPRDENATHCVAFWNALRSELRCGSLPSSFNASYLLDVSGISKL